MKEVVTEIIQEPVRISCNYEQSREAIQEILDEYKGAVFTEEQKPIAKKHVASLRAQKKALQDNLRSAEKRYMVPWNEVKSQVNELIGMFDDTISLINGQVQAFEEKRIEERKALISDLYAECVCEINDMSDILPLKKIYNPKWENATVTPKGIRTEMMTRKEEARKAVNTIKEMNSDVEEEALNMYRNTYDLTSCISFISRHEAQKKEILERERERIRREEEERVRREERERMLAEQRAREEKEAAVRQAELERQEALRRAEEEKAEALRRAELARQEEARRAEAEKAAAVEQARAEAAQEVIDSLIPDDGDGTELYEYRISLSADAKEKLEMYMDSVGIEWEMI